jgi:hypothetical protein
VEGNYEIQFFDYADTDNNPYSGKQNLLKQCLSHANRITYR